MDNRPIGIFDSGVGAFSVLREMVRIMPDENYVYFADSGHNPYGQKSRAQLQMLCGYITDFLMKQDAKSVVIACNTATAASLDYLRERFDIKIIGVIEPAAREALRVSPSKKIGVCATCFTADTHAYRDRILQFDPSAEVSEAGSRDLANIVENGFEYTEENDALIREFAGRVSPEADTLILGCTHYPLVRPLFEKYFPKNIVDPGLQTALEMKAYLEENDMRGNAETAHVRYFTSTEPEKFIRAAAHITDMEISDIRKVDFDDFLKENHFEEL